MSKYYHEKLKNPKWQKKRLEILQRDDFKCVLCNDTESTLHVHHTTYRGVDNPWEIDNRLLLTLCETCHKTEHELWEVKGTLLQTFLDIGVTIMEVYWLAYIISRNKEFRKYVLNPIISDVINENLNNNDTEPEWVSEFNRIFFRG